MIPVRTEDLEKGEEIDLTTLYRREEKIPPEFGRVSIRYRDGNYELYVHWPVSKTDEVLISSDDIHSVVESANELMKDMELDVRCEVVEDMELMI